ncbi:DUF547 domain-containing protein [Aestuariibaculum sediminum]|uniref:DUF547 domain-containing protein n=1 Tax=Aestuariibaculum sediminum TaxID=2770637 RepID=A0A8J6Q5J8_9FLAO|nr:DUF547 domain-containing protein [Aestuariibaculum sediminum]MBD0830778.1 DUF547 domain-containing protein [Aestuariibaculum sediminum]
MKLVLCIFLIGSFQISRYELQAQENDSRLWNTLLQKHVTPNGIVDYKAFKKQHHILKDYIHFLSEHVPGKTANKNEVLAFWINAYNALTIDLVLRHYPISSIKNIKKPWKQPLWKFNEQWYDLSTIEHDILRKMEEPRIHFAINCASISCPKLQNFAFTPNQLEEQLTIATTTFLNDTTKNSISINQLELSKIFKWYRSDFLAQDKSIAHFISRYTESTISENATISFKPYNWNLNE